LIGEFSPASVIQSSSAVADFRSSESAQESWQSALAGMARYRYAVKRHAPLRPSPCSQRVSDLKTSGNRIALDLTANQRVVTASKDVVSTVAVPYFFR
jgi:hypothetical protein